MNSYRDTLGHRGFQPFLWAQFLGAINDNLFKIVVTMLAVGGATAASEGRAVALVGALFILPFLLFSGYAGQLADACSKRTILVVTKAFEIVVMGLGMIALAAGHLEAAYAVLFLMALHSTFFSPAKYGILPEALPETELSRANGLLEMSTFAAIVLGSAAGTALYALWDERLPTIGIALTVIAAVGAAVSIGIPHVGPARRPEPLRWNPWAGLSAGLARLTSERTLWMTAVGVAWFWFLGALLQMAVLAAGRHVMQLGDGEIAALGACLAVGVAGAGG